MGLCSARCEWPPGWCSAFWLSAVGAQAEKCPFITLHPLVRISHLSFPEQRGCKARY